MPTLSDIPLSSIGTRRIALAGKLEHRRTALPGALPGRLELEGPGRARPTQASRPGHAFYAERVVMSGSNDRLAREPCKGSAELAVVFGLIAGDGVKMILAWRRHIDHSSRGENASIGLHNPFRIAATCFSRTQGCRLSVGNPGAALHNPFRGRPVGRAVWICRDACVVSCSTPFPMVPIVRACHSSEGIKQSFETAVPRRSGAWERGRVETTRPMPLSRPLRSPAPCA